MRFRKCLEIKRLGGDRYRRQAGMGRASSSEGEGRGLGEQPRRADRNTQQGDSGKSQLPKAQVGRCPSVRALGT